MLETIRILITGTGAPGLPSILSCLRNNGERDLYIVGVDMNPAPPFRKKVDRFYQVPSASDPEFIHAVLQICQKEKIRVLISIVTRELELFAAAKEQFAAVGTTIATMDSGPLHIANNKGLLLTAMKEAGLQTPAFRIVYTPDELKEAVLALGYPEKRVVIKPTFGNGSRGTRILDEKESRYDRFFTQKPGSQVMRLEEVLAIVQEKGVIPEMMVMEYLPGEEICVDVLADHGKVLYLSCRCGRVVSSIMVSSVVRNNPYAAELAENVVKLLSLDGNIDFDMKTDENGRPQIMEINPRLPAGVAVQTMAGINFPYLRIKQLLGEQLPDCKAVEGYEMQFCNREIIFAPDGAEAEWSVKI